MVSNRMNEFCQSLKTWRAARRFSQLQLAMEADISARHLSFLETGRARPSREMVARLGEALRLPLDVRNQLLTDAGFAARYRGRDWNDADMAPIRRAVDHMLDGHMPYPGLALNRVWTIMRANQAALTLFQSFGVGVGDSLLDLVLSDDMSQTVENWPEVARHSAARLRIESRAQGGVPELDRAIAYLSRFEDSGDQNAPSPVVPTIFKIGDARLSMFATIAQFGTPEDLALEDLKIELYFPSDDVTDTALRAFSSSG